ncbi:MAG: hypothetical protein QM673_08310 [Gordonia sp. (in: high G+C Gram-positive bacteria)]
MASNPSARAWAVAWAVMTALVLVVRLLASLGTVVCVMAWVVAMVRDSWQNIFFWPALACGAALLLSTYAYSLLRAHYPRRSGRRP